MEKSTALKVVKVVPDRDKLSADVRKNITCPIEGCGRVLAQSAALRFHLVQSHKIVQNEEDKCFVTKKAGKEAAGDTRVQYHCPESTCHFNEQSTRHFSSIKLLKQHYMKIHAPKIHKCSKCEKNYALDRDRRRHEAECGQVIVCDVCKVQFGCKSSLLKHCKSFKHQVPLRFQMHRLLLPLMPTGDYATQKPLQSTPQTVSVHPSANTSQVTHTAINMSVPSIVPKPSVIFIPMPIATNGTNHHIDPPPIIMMADCRPHPTPQHLKRTLPVLRQSQMPPEKSQVRFADSQDNTDPIDMVRRDVDTQTDILANLLPVNAAMRFNPPSASFRQDSASTSTQTYSFRLKGTAAQTQTSGDMILQKAMQSANIPIRKESRGSQVSPRVRRKRPSLCEMTTQTSPRKRIRKTRKIDKKDSTQETGVISPHTSSISSTVLTNEWTSAVSTGMQRAPSFNLNNSDTPLWNDLCDNETQTMALLQELDESLAESIATQTFDPDLTESISRQTFGRHVAASISTQTLESFLSENPAPSCQQEIGQQFPQNVSDSGSLEQLCLDVDLNTTCENLSQSKTVDGSSLLCDLGFTSAAQSTLASSSSSLLSVNQSVVSTLFEPNIATSTSASSRKESSTDPLFGGDYFSVGGNVSSSGDLISDNQQASTVETQTMNNDFDFREFLTAASQTTDLDNVNQMHTQTQTMGDVFDQLFTNMETQTTNNENSFMSEFGFVDIETQTNSIFQQNSPELESTSVETQFSPTDMQTQTTINLSNSGSLFLSTAETQTSLQMAAPPTLRSQQTETQTQTLFSHLDAFTPGLQDSHTQTTWNELETLMKNLS